MVDLAQDSTSADMILHYINVFFVNMLKMRIKK